MKAGVVGAGIMGRMLALQLHNAGWQVSLFDQVGPDSEPTCSQVAAGLLTPVSELEKAGPTIFQLGQESLQVFWPKILKQLPDSIYFKTLGSLVIHHPQDWAEWQRFSSLIQDKIEEQKSYVLTHTQILELEPELGAFPRAYFFPDEAHIDSQAVFSALETYLRNQGIEWRPNTLVKHVDSGQVFLDDGTETFDMVFDCRGLGAINLFPKLRGVRGELIWVHAPEVHLQRPIRLLHPRYRIYITPRPNQYYLIGATELESAASGPISVRTTLELLTAAYSVHSGFAEAQIIKNTTQVRPTLPNHLPSIQRREGLVAVNGLYRHGYLIAPSLAKEIVRGVSSNYTDIHYPTLWENNDNHYH